MGGEAQFVSFKGHDVAEAVAGGERYLVDANLEVLMKGNVEKVVQDKSKLREAYSMRTEGEIEHLPAVYSTDAGLGGYDNYPTGSPQVYAAQKMVAVGKWVFPIILLGIGFFIRLKE